MKSEKSVEIVAGILTAVISGLMTWAVFSGASCVICWLVRRNRYEHESYA